jgi:hypothetical protein
VKLQDISRNKNQFDYSKDRSKLSLCLERIDSVEETEQAQVNATNKLLP